MEEDKLNCCELYVSFLQELDQMIQHHETKFNIQNNFHDQ